MGEFARMGDRLTRRFGLDDFAAWTTRSRMTWSAVVLGVVLATSTATAGSMPERRAPMLVPKTDHEALRAQTYASFPRSEGRWGAVHVVDRTCSTSRAVVAHLIERRASAEMDELVIVIDPDGATARADIDLVHAGYRVRVIVQTRINDVMSIATPSMIVARPDGTLAYVGGHRHTLAFVDAGVIGDLVAHGTTAIAAAVVGCSEPTSSSVSSRTPPRVHKL